ncbi:MAG: NAD(P)-dependent oxidoreductase [Chromatiales bacterium]|jgi:3-hydroxyisobutyrate dehydrogenase-like beta-hydroxyacid dehydrogenase
MNIAVLGLGLMGVAVARRLQDQGQAVKGWNRGDARRDAAAAQGLEVTGRVEEAIDGSDCVILTLSDAAAIGAVLTGEEVEPALAGRVAIQMGTIAPSESRDLERRLRGAGADYLEAPVLGSIPEARSGRLIVMAGGPEPLFQRCLPLLRLLGERPRLIGPTGQGAALKLAMNQLIGALTAGFSASLGLVRAEGIDVDLFMDLLRGSALYAPTFDKKLGKMLDGQYGSPNFPLKHLIKDLALFERVAAGHAMDVRVPAALGALSEEALLAGHGDEDYSSLYEAVNPEGHRRDRPSTTPKG